MIKRDCLCLYRFFAPFNGRYTDKGESLFEIPISDYEFPATLALFGQDAQLAFARIQVEGQSQESDNTIGSRHVLEDLFQHLLGTLRLAGYQRLEWVALFAATYPKAGSSCGLEMDASAVLAEPEPTNWEGFAQLLGGTSGYRSLVGYFATGVNASLPEEFRFLAIFLMLERIYMRNNRWDQKGVNEVLAIFRDQLAPTGCSRSTFAYLNDLRNKCCHARVGKKDGEGAHALNSEALKQVRDSLNGMIALGIHLLLNRANLRVMKEEPSGIHSVRLFIPTIPSGTPATLLADTAGPSK